jgi:GcrA cell cycle regulator
MTTPSEHARFVRRQRHDWWTAERKAQLVDLLKVPEIKAMEIADKLGNGATKMSVIGFCNRNGLKLPLQSGSHGRPKGPPKPARHRGRQAAWALQRTPPKQERFAMSVIDLPHTWHCQVAELDNERCRWPYGDPGTPGFYFCGLPEADMTLRIPYCATHMRQAYHRQSGGRIQARSKYDPMVSAA